MREWQDLLALPAGELALKLISRDREMVRLRNSSPFYLAEGIHFGDYDVRVRLRIVMSGDGKLHTEAGAGSLRRRFKKLRIEGADAVAIGDTPYDDEGVEKAKIATVYMLRSLRKALSWPRADGINLSVRTTVAR